METVRKLIFEELEKEQEYNMYGNLNINAINFIGYKNKKNIGKLVLVADSLDIDITELKYRVESVLDENDINYSSIYLEL